MRRTVTHGPARFASENYEAEIRRFDNAIIVFSIKLNANRFLCEGASFMNQTLLISSLTRMQRYANPHADLRAVGELSAEEAFTLLDSFRRAHPELDNIFARMATAHLKCVRTGLKRTNTNERSAVR
jgi:hypothetical protein